MSPQSLPQSILQTSELLRQGSLSPVELTTACLARIEELNPKLNAFITITAESALAQARQAEAEIRRGDWRGPLHGIPLALKDLIDTAGVRTTAASLLFKDRIPAEDAQVVRRLKAAGAVLLGKQNLHEFAYGASSMISAVGEVHNAWNREHIAGGSSGGSATSVAAGLGYGAIGTDTAGSVREPAALCGVVGLKPTYGRVSARGVIPLSISLDHVGPIGRTVADVAVIFAAIAGHDAADKASVDVPVEDYVAVLRRNLQPLQIGVPKKFFFEDLDAEVASAINHAISGLAAMGARMRDIELPVPTDRTLQSAESYAFHAEFVAHTPDLYQTETLRRIRSGQNVSQDGLLESRGELERASDRIGGKPEFCRLPTPTSKRPHGTSESPCHPERRIAFRTRNAMRSRRIPMTSTDVSRSLGGSAHPNSQ
ncbi:MAG: Asp-tRNA(Asn)/Glu-tRNA(Gln) amidotransferase GatCAB subunit A [Acidobacteriia bacterium]|nr:Asp-tRNA(Asn)/Glu-tRNA(Gln) amidotransferase GatCAB subunit A [Terriglobia bacterium]